MYGLQEVSVKTWKKPIDYMSSIIMCNFRHRKKSEIFHLVTFTEDIFNGKLHFLCCESYQQEGFTEQIKQVEQYITPKYIYTWLQSPVF